MQTTENSPAPKQDRDTIRDGVQNMIDHGSPLVRALAKASRYIEADAMHFALQLATHVAGIATAVDRAERGHECGFAITDPTECQQQLKVWQQRVDAHKAVDEEDGYPAGVS